LKTLYCLRHAKSSWAEPGTDDHDRPLSPRGTRAAELVAVYLKQRGSAPHFALSSTALRAVETLAPIRRQLGLAFATDRGLYLAEPHALCQRIAQVDDREPSLLLIGHNPGMHELAMQLAGRGDRALRARLRERFPTAALAVLELDVESWGEVAPGCASLVELTTPADLV
jgi:phosphohistidine phosphatase